MAYQIKTNYAHKSNYGAYRNPSKIQYIVWHYTANDGDSDESNARYFKTANRKTSAHFFVDDDSVTISVPETYTAWSVGGSRYSNYKTTGGAAFYKLCTNTNSISIELCDTNKNGIYDVSEKTLENAIALTRQLMDKYDIPIENVIRHFDVTGKPCPAYYVENNKWNPIKMKITGTSIATEDASISTENNFLVKVTVSALNIRSGAGTGYKKTGCIRDKGLYTIVKTSGSWGYLKSGAGWINISSKYVQKLSTQSKNYRKDETR